MKNNTLYTKCPREARYYLITLLDPNNINEYHIELILNYSVTKQLTIVNNKINNISINNEIKENIINDIKNNANNNLIPMRELEWIDKKNKRLCYYIFSITLMLEKSYIGDVFSENNDSYFFNMNKIHLEKETTNTHYDFFKLNRNVTNIDEIYHKIILFFDILRVDYDSKLELLSRIKNLWTKVSKDKYNWLSSKNEEQIDWMYCYLYKFNITPWFF